MRRLVGVLGVIIVALMAYITLAGAANSLWAPKTISGYVVVAACGTPPETLVAGQVVAPEVNTSGQLCVHTTAP